MVLPLHPEEVTITHSKEEDSKGFHVLARNILTQFAISLTVFARANVGEGQEQHDQITSRQVEQPGQKNSIVQAGVSTIDTPWSWITAKIGKASCPFGSSAD